jgi:PASTA domain/F5/8 type C domain
MEDGMTRRSLGWGLIAMATAATVCTFVFVPSAAAAPPANDDFTNAQMISGDSGTLGGTTIEATTEPNEPDHAGFPAQASVWYRWTAPADGIASFDTCSADFNTRLAVYTGAAPADLVEVASNDNSDDCGVVSVQSSLTLVARSGSTYQIAVDALGATGTFTLAWERVPLPPTNTTRPSVSGSPLDGGTLSVTPGGWTSAGPVSYSYRWQRCGGAMQNVALGKPAFASRELPGNEASEAVDGSPWTYWNSGDFPPQWIEVDLEAPYPLSAIRAAITQLPDGMTTHQFFTAGPNPLDEFTLLATFSDFTKDQQVLEHPGPSAEAEYILVETTASPSWVGWREIEALSSCADIAGATGTSYTLTPVDIGSTIRAVVTATNSTGPTAASSSATATIGPLAPISLGTPAVSGTAKHRNQLSATPGSWRGSAPISYGYQWQRCDRAATRCINIVGATNPTYVVRLADTGSTLRVAVTASNTAGSATAVSALTTPVPYQCIVPNLKRRTVRAARRQLTASHCRLGSAKRHYSSRVARGRIISQRPGRGTELADRAKVSVIVSRGRRR